MSQGLHKCAYGNMEEITTIEESLISRGFVKSAEGQSQKDIPLGEYVIVCVKNTHHHRTGIPYRIAWCESVE